MSFSHHPPCPPHYPSPNIFPSPAIRCVQLLLGCSDDTAANAATPKPHPFLNRKHNTLLTVSPFSYFDPGFWSDRHYHAARRYSSLLSILFHVWICSSPSCCTFLEFTHILSGSKIILCLVLLRDHFKDKLTLSVITTNWYLWVISRLCLRINCFIISLNPGSGHRVSLPAVSKQKFIAQ